jgi:hypothetical protein
MMVQSPSLSTASGVTAAAVLSRHDLDVRVGPGLTIVGTELPAVDHAATLIVSTSS